VRFLPEKRTRAPLALGCKPSAANITPAFTNSSLKRPISANSSVVGIAPDSDSSVALTITNTRMSFLLNGLPGGELFAAVITTGNEDGENPHIASSSFQCLVLQARTIY
jgi:hypothetical protein